MRIQTATGAIDPDDLGTTLMHEHVESIAPPGFYSGGGDGDIEDLALRALACLPDSGVESVVDLAGRTRATGQKDLDVITRMAPRLPVNVVVGFALYKEPWLETVSDIDEMVGLFVTHATDGIWGSDIRAGIYGEVGTSLGRITPREELHLRAAARAHLITGLAISTHCTLGTMAPEQVEILADEDADLSRIVLGHLDLRPDIDYLERVLGTGVNIAFDTFGKEWFDYRVSDSEGQGGAAFVKRAYHRPDEDRLRALSQLVAGGYRDQIVLSCDISGAEAYLNPSTHGRYGYAYLPQIVLPRLRQAGVDDTSLGMMLIDNPARILAIP